MNDRRMLVACGSLVVVWASGCAEPCVDDGLIQDPEAAGCPGIDGGDTDEPDPSTTTDDDVDVSGPEPSCDNGIEDGDETDVDCGGACADQCGTGQGCEDDDDCTTAECGPGMTCEEPPSCVNEILDGDETDVDCGGSCPPCDDGEMCQVPGDCTSELCEDGTCDPPICRDGVLNGDETDLDCGGSCPPCADGDMCLDGTDCKSGLCADGTCDSNSCRDGVLNGDETDIDCGGSKCEPCDDGEDCLEDSDCASQLCDPEDGTCLAPSCTDGLLNGDETDLDCGGACGATCDPGEDCVVGMDCLSFGCAPGTNVCNDYLTVVAAPSCSNFEDAAVGLSATASGGSGVYTYTWTPNDGSLTTPDQAMTEASPTGFQSYLVTVDDGFNTAGDSVVVVSSQPFDLQGNCTTTSANFGVSSSGADASITYDMGGMRGCENGNNEFGLTLCETVVFENTSLRGTLEVVGTGEIPPDNDWVGLVWGAQDNSHFYSMIWKQSFQSGAGFSPPLPCDTPGGILVRRIDAPSFAVLTGADFFCAENTPNSVLLAAPELTTTEGWVLDEAYAVTIDFTNAGSAVTVVRESDLVEVASFLVADTTYTTGYFGSTTASQQGACVGPLYAECL
jgi:hypothetical protein